MEPRPASFQFSTDGLLFRLHVQLHTLWLYSHVRVSVKDFLCELQLSFSFSGSYEFSLPKPHQRRVRRVVEAKHELTTFSSSSGSQGFLCELVSADMVHAWVIDLGELTTCSSAAKTCSHHNVVDQLSGRFWFGQNCQELSGRLCWPVPRHCSHRRVLCNIMFPLHEFEVLLNCSPRTCYLETRSFHATAATRFASDDSTRADELSSLS